MDEQLEQVSAFYTPPMLIEVGEFNEDTLGGGGIIYDGLDAQGF